MRSSVFVCFQMVVVGPTVVFLACVASFVMQQHGLGRVHTWPLLAWLALAQLSLPPSLRVFVGMIGPALVAAMAYAQNNTLVAVLWTLVALASGIWREKPKVEFELM
jgi:hypothetical protein